MYTFFLSFTDLAGWETEYSFNGIKNYVNLFQNEFFLKAFRNTWIIWLMNFTPQIGLAILLSAWLTSVRLRVKGSGLFKAIFYLPNIITAASISVLFASLFNFPTGAVNVILTKLGIMKEPFEFFRSVFATRSIVAFIQFWMWYGHTFIILSAGIMGINPQLYEAGMIDGATDSQMFRKITLPLLKPILIYVFVTSLIGGMQMFDIPFLLTNMGSPDYSIETMAMFIYRQAFTGSRNYYVAAAASVILLGIILVFSTIIFRATRDRDKSYKDKGIMDSLKLGKKAKKEVGAANE